MWPHLALCLISYLQKKWQALSIFKGMWRDSTFPSISCLEGMRMEVECPCKEEENAQLLFLCGVHRNVLLQGIQKGRLGKKGKASKAIKYLPLSGMSAVGQTHTWSRFAALLTQQLLWFFFRSSCLTHQECRELWWVLFQEHQVKSTGEKTNYQVFGFFCHEFFQNSGFDFCMIVSDSHVKVSCVLCIESNSPYESFKSQKIGGCDGL